MSKYLYTVIFEQAEEGGWTAEVPALNHLTTQGETLEEAMAMAHDAIEGYLEVLSMKSLPIPNEAEEQRIIVIQLETTRA